MTKSGIVEHYKENFRVVKADTEELRIQAYRLRFQVYCKEFRYEKQENFPRELEKDDFDVHAQHCLLFHKHRNRAIGYLRLIVTDNRRDGDDLPIKRYCLDSIDQRLFSLENLTERRVGEFSRLAVSSAFRRRQADYSSPYGLPAGRDICGVEERRSHHPVIPLSLALAGFAMILRSDLDYGLAMMEPRLSNMLRRYGILFDKIGHLVDYHGHRAPYVLLVKETLGRLSDDARALLEVIDAEMALGHGGAVAARAEKMSEDACG